jgi:hypothetical protein
MGVNRNYFFVDIDFLAPFYHTLRAVCDANPERNQPAEEYYAKYHNLIK